jgi:hypothetical protein
LRDYSVGRIIISRYTGRTEEAMSMDVITSDVYNCETLLSVLAESSRNGYGCRGIYGWAYDKERSCTLLRRMGKDRFSSLR